MELISTDIPPELIKDVQEKKTTAESEEPVLFEDVEKTLVKKLLENIKPGEKRLIGRVVREIEKAPNRKRLKQLSIAIGIIGVGTLGITGYILLTKAIKEKMNKLS